MNVQRPEGFQVDGIEHFILRHGLRYTPHPLPAGYQRGPQKQCFTNSYTLSVNEQLVYVEGYVLLPQIPIPIIHAWCVKPGSDKVIDVTSSDLVEYYGVPFQSRYVVSQACATRYAGGLLDAWLYHWPLMKMTQEQLKNALHRSARFDDDANESE